jgi:hypothetical protein
MEDSYMKHPDGKCPCPRPDSLAGMPDGPGSRTKLVRVTVPGVGEFDLKRNDKIRFSVYNGRGDILIGHLDLGSISYWRDPNEHGKGRHMYWENLQKWMALSTRKN